MSKGSVKRARLVAMFDEGTRQIRAGKRTAKLATKVIRAGVRNSNAISKIGHQIRDLGRSLIDQGERRRETAYQRAEESSKPRKAESEPGLKKAARRKRKSKG